MNGHFIVDAVHLGLIELGVVVIELAEIELLGGSGYYLEEGR